MWTYQKRESGEVWTQVQDGFICLAASAINADDFVGYVLRADTGATVLITRARMAEDVRHDCDEWLRAFRETADQAYRAEAERHAPRL